MITPRDITKLRNGHMRAMKYTPRAKRFEQDRFWNRLPYAGVASINKKWFWVVFLRHFSEWDENLHSDEGQARLANPDHQGWADTKDAAIAEISAALGHDDFFLADALPAQWVYSFTKDARRQEQAKRVTTGDARVTEYLYGWDSYLDDYDSNRSHYVTVWRVVKKTRLFVFVGDRTCGKWTPAEGVKLYGGRDLSEKAFRVPVSVYVDGHARPVSRRSLRYEIGGELWVNPMDAWRDMNRFRVRFDSEQAPSCIAALGLSWPTTPAEVRAAYKRLAKECHPDTGGDSAQFVTLKANYEQALAIAAV